MIKTMINIDIRNFEEDVISLFNSSDLPAEVKRLVAETVLNLITSASDRAILAESEEIKNAESA